MLMHKIAQNVNAKFHKIYRYMPIVHCIDIIRNCSVHFADIHHMTLHAAVWTYVLLSENETLNYLIFGT